MPIFVIYRPKWFAIYICKTFFDRALAKSAAKHLQSFNDYYDMRYKWSQFLWTI